MRIVIKRIDKKDIDWVVILYAFVSILFLLSAIGLFTRDNVAGGMIHLFLAALWAFNVIFRAVINRREREYKEKYKRNY
jgi:hypothetical protein